MSKALVTMGSKTTHGHFCPKCRMVVSAIAADQSTTVLGRAVVIAGDKTNCGATFLGNQNLTVSAK